MRSKGQKKKAGEVIDEAAKKATEVVEKASE